MSSDKTANQAKAKNLSYFTLLIVYLFVRFLHVRSISIYCHGYFFFFFFFFFCTSFDLQKEKTKEIKKNRSSVIESHFLQENIEP